jgi:thiosulfate/3-mercaptopyruvate sulfurtransferase
MDYVHPEALVETQWLHDHLDAPDVRVVDGTYYLPMQHRDAREEYEARHIPGAVFFDVEEISDTSADLPHMLPSPEKFSARMRKLGLGDGNRIIVYDAHGMMSAARVWWTFRVFGHDDVAVLNGGLPKWLAERRPVEDLAPMPAERHLTARFNTLLVRDKEQIRRNIGSGRELVVDARSRGRFEGTEQEIWPGRRGGHIPGSLNVPYTHLLDSKDRTFVSGSEIRRKFEAAGVDWSKPVVTTCGSGITAAVLALGLHLAGHDDVAVYDGSWAEWGLPGDTEVATGPAAMA